MCLFNFPNKVSGKARLKGIEEFECGHCPECLQKKSRRWALRCSMEAKVSPGVMVTLTYDTYKVVNGKESTHEENPINPNMQLSKRDCQLFLKRLRKHFEPLKIKYLLTAERGKKGRAHYHALLFGVNFPDLVKYKMSDRGNWIYKSQTLTKLWGLGICTVDCVNLSAKTARYCTKYCAKDSGAEETFMLFSRGIGDEMLLKLFNGKSYWIDGREYSIPRQIWQKVIEKRYNCKGYSKYVGREHVEVVEKWIYNQFKKLNKKSLKNPNYPGRLLRDKVWNKARRRLENSDKLYEEQAFKREIYEKYRDNDSQYIEYLEYWAEKERVAKITRPSVEERILALPNNKYLGYKNKATRAKIIQNENKSRFIKRDFIPPRSNCQGFVKEVGKIRKEYKEKSFAPLARHYRANDTARIFFQRTVKQILFKQEYERIRKALREGVYIEKEEDFHYLSIILGIKHKNTVSYA